MKIIFLILTTVLIFACSGICAAQTRRASHTPKKGGAERRLILDALRGGAETRFRVNFLKVRSGWAWIDATPLDAQGRATAEGGASLLHLESGRWRVKDLSVVPLDPNNPMGAMDVSPIYLAHLRKTFPGVPSDIFPKPRS